MSRVCVCVYLMYNTPFRSGGEKNRFWTDFNAPNKNRSAFSLAIVISGPWLLRRALPTLRQQRSFFKKLADRKPIAANAGRGGGRSLAEYYRVWVCDKCMHIGVCFEW